MAQKTRGARMAAVAALIGAFWLGAAFAPPTAHAQSAGPFAGFKHDNDQPVDIEADSLEVRDEENLAIFRGGASSLVKVKQGEAQIFARTLQVWYSGGGAGGGVSGSIARIRAEGDVFISNGEEHAEAKVADYAVGDGEILLTGDVILVQDGNVVSGQKLRIDLNTGQARMESGGGQGGGRVRISLDPSKTDN